MEIPVSIFNDVLGPIMRGPSSSHTAASARIGSIAAQLLGDEIKCVLVEFTPDGSLASTYDGQGSDIGLAAGLMGLDLSSSDLVDSLSLIRKRGIELTFKIQDYPNNHPNTYKLTLTSIHNKKLEVIGISTGGGMIKITHLNGFEVDISGGYFEFFLFARNSGNDIIKAKLDHINKKYVSIGIEFTLIKTQDDIALINIKSTKEIGKDIRAEIASELYSLDFYYTEPVLPVKSRALCNVPFNNASELIKALPNPNTPLWEMALNYEAERGDISKEEVWKLALNVYMVMKEAVRIGLAGTEYKDRILGRQSHLIGKALTAGRILNSPLENSVIQNTMAVMESKSSFQVIVAAPTAGSCATIPGAIIGCADVFHFSDVQ